MDVAKKSLKLEIIQCIYILLKHFLRKSLYILCIYNVVQCIYTGLSSGLRVMQIVGGPKNRVTSRSLDFSNSKRKNFFLRDFIKDFEEKNFFFFEIHRNELRFKNNHQNVLKPKYVVNELLKRIWVAFDDFLKKFRGADDFFRKF